MDVTLSSVRTALTAATADAATRLERCQATLCPEIAAAVSGFANSTRLEDGLYAIVDVGGGTVDCCTFNLFKMRQGGACCPIFNAQVEMLGVEPWHRCENDPIATDDFDYLLGVLQKSVIWDTKLKRHPNSDRWKKGLPLFFVGGGVKSQPHQESTRSLDPWLRHHTSRQSYVRIEALPAPENLEHPLCDDKEVHRLAVAIGLSLPVTDIPMVDLPVDIVDIPPATRSSRGGRYVDKDQV